MPQPLGIAEAYCGETLIKRTKAADTLSTIAQLIDCKPLEALLQGLYKSNQRTVGRPPIGL